MLNPLKLKQILGTTDDAHKIAQKNATDLLGLPPDNTALDRAKALGFDVDNTYYHGTANIVDKPQINEGIFQVQDLGKERVIKEFDNKYLGSTTGSDNQAHWFTNDPKTAETYSDYNAYMNAFAKLDTKFNQLKEKGISKLTDADRYDDWYKKLDDADQFELYSIQEKKKMLLDSSGSRGEHILPVYLRNNNQIVNDAEGSGWLSYFAEKDRTKGVKKGTELLEQAKREGKDSVLFKNLNDTASKYYQQPSNQVAVLNPSSIRSKFAAFDPKKLGVGAGSVMSADLLANENNMSTLQRLGLLTEPENVLKEPYRNPIQQGIGMYGDLMQTPGLNFLFGDIGTGLQDISYGQPPNEDAVLDAKMSLFAGINPLANAVSKYNKFRKFIPEGKFTPDEMNAIFKDRVLSEYGDMTRMYEKLKGSQGGKVIDTDTAREMFPEYIQNRLRATDVHEGASTYSKKYYKDLLSEPTTKSVLFTAGGPAVGKSRALNKLKANDPNQIMFDTNMANYDSAVSKIDEALKQNKPVNIVYVHKSPLESFQEGALNRMLNQKSKFGSGRTVQVKDFVDIHKKSNENIRKIADHYKDNPNVRIDYVDNTDWNNPMVVNKKDIPKLDKSNKEYEQSIVSFMNQKRKEGTIDQEMYEKTLGNLLGF